jgi:predicted amidohydrolase YtcJ
MSMSRRQFVMQAGALAAAGLAAPRIRAHRPERADLVIRAGIAHTMDPAYPDADAVAVAGDCILAVGRFEQLTSLVGPGTHLIDARDATLVPGFIDAHSHPIAANEAISANVGYRTIAEVQQALRERARTTPKGQWLLGHLYDDTKFEEGRPVSRSDLDAVSTRHPIFIRHRGGHTGVVNSRALDVAGITLDTPDPDGGRFYRDGNGFTGKVAETAIGRFTGTDNWPQPTRENQAENVRLSTRRMAASGITSTTDAYGSVSGWRAYSDAKAAGNLSCRIAFMPGARTFAGETRSAYELLKSQGLRSGDGDALLRVGAVKYTADGSASERTMFMSSPYQGRPDDYGLQIMGQAAIDEAVDQAHADGYRIGIHANGDVAIDMVLNAYERVLGRWRGPNPRLRIEHCSLVTPALLARIKATGSVPTPFYTYAYYHGEKWHEYGQERMEWMFAHRSFLDYGIKVAPASDYPPGPYDPLMALQSMVTRKDYRGDVWGPSRRIRIAEALKICTLHGAYASFEEHLKGSLTPGKLADLVLLDGDPMRVAPESLIDLSVVRTVMGGTTTYEA